MRWDIAYRSISIEYEPLYFYLRAPTAAMLPSLIALESLYDPGLRAVGDIDQVMPYLRVAGKGAEYIMTPFVFPDQRGTRFAPPGGPGVFYGANDRDTALQEKGFHFGRYLRRSSSSAGPYAFGLLEFALTAPAMYDVRGSIRQAFPALYGADYTVAQKLALVARTHDFDGIVYESVRNPGGFCVAVFKPPLITNCHLTHGVTAHFDGKRITRYVLTP